MAYLDRDGSFACGTPVVSAPARPVAASPTRSSFSDLEWRVIGLARKDSLRSLSTPGPLSRMLGGIFGRRAATRLADPRLEALRRLAVYAHHRGFALPATEVDRFLDQGFVLEQAELLVAG